MKNNNSLENQDIPLGAEIFLAKGIIQNIVEGETAIVDRLAQKATNNDIILLKSCLLGGLELAFLSVTVNGLHALGHLIAVSKIISRNDSVNNKCQNNRFAHVTADALLSMLICTLGSQDSLGGLEKVKESGIVLSTRDADLVAALLAVKDKDRFYVSNFVKLLKLIFIEPTDFSIEERQNWSVSEEFTEKLREKALQANNNNDNSHKSIITL